MILGVDPKVDYAFKRMLGRESTRPILINVVDSVLNPSPGHHIQEVELKPVAKLAYPGSLHPGGMLAISRG